MKRFFIPFAINVLIALACVTPAGAADYSIRSCSQSPDAGLTAEGKGWSALMAPATAPGAAIGTCPGGMSFNTTRTAAYGVTGAWSFKFAALPSANHLKFDYEGGETTTGWTYRVSDCAATCQVLATLPERSATDPPAVFDLDLPGATLIKVTAKCEAATCGASQPLNFHDVVASVHDVKPPTANVVTNADYWIDPRDAMASVSIWDHGGMGLSTSIASVDDGNGFLGRGECGFDFFLRGTTYLPADAMCEQSIGWPYQRLNLNGVTDGTHNIVVNSVDAAGNQMPTFKRKLRLDSTPPNTPEDVELSGVNEFGWTQLATVGASWTNTGEEAETMEQSGIRLPSYERKPYPGFEVDSAKVAGVFEQDTPKSIKSIALPTDGRWNVYISTTDRAGNQSGAAKIVVGRDRGVPAAPTLDDSPWMNQSALNVFRQSLTQPTGGEISGICGYAVAVNTDDDTIPGPEITQSGALESLAVGSAVPDGVNWLHARAISCAGVPSGTATGQLRIDRAPPLTYVDGLPSSQWTNRPITARVSAVDALSGVKRVAYYFDEDAARIAPESGLTPPRGHHVLHYLAEDGAGNLAPTADREIRFDDLAPELAIDPPNANDPVTLSGRVTDRLSGLSVAVFEYRRAGAGEEWTTLPTSASPEADDVGATRVRATISDADLDPGQYDFRLRASDVAGNGAATQLPTATLPLRRQPKISVQLAEVSACKAKSKCSPPSARIKRRGAKSARTVDFGEPVAVIGQLRDTGGAPIAGAALKLYSAVGGANRVLAGTATTNARGRFAFPPSRGASRRFTVAYGGTPQVLPVAGSVDLGVTVGAVLKVSRSTVRSGETVRFSGRVLGVTSERSAAGLRVLIKYFKPGSGWKPAVDAPVADSDGRFVAAPYRFTGTAATTIKFKALVVTRRTGFPYVEGYTNVSRVRLLR